MTFFAIRSFCEIPHVPRHDPGVAGDGDYRGDKKRYGHNPNMFEGQGQTLAGVVLHETKYGHGVPLFTFRILKIDLHNAPMDIVVVDYSLQYAIVIDYGKLFPVMKEHL